MPMPGMPTGPYVTALACLGVLILVSAAGLAFWLGLRAIIRERGRGVPRGIGPKKGPSIRH